MRLPRRVQFKLRWLMASVAIVGLILGGGISLWQRRVAFFTMSQKHEWAALIHRKHGSVARHEDRSCREFQEKEYPPSEGGIHDHPMGGLTSKRTRRYLEYQYGLAEKYWYATDHPWLPVAPDLPPPPLPDD